MARVTLALAGDTMLGRGVATHLETHPVRSLFGPELLELVAGTDGVLLNLECCISDRGEPRPGRVFHFRAPPVAVEALTLLGVRCVSLANNHALDFGEEALLDTLARLRAAGIPAAGAGGDDAAARAPRPVRFGPLDVDVLACTDHPADYAATPGRPGVAYADLRAPRAWPEDAVRRLASAGRAVLVTPHWGPNMNPDPLPEVRGAAARLQAAGATLVAGHSAHVVQGVSGRVLFDLGDFVDDYATDPVLRNDLGLLWLVTLEDAVPVLLEAVPLHLGYCRTTIASGDDAAWIRRRFGAACRALGTEVGERAGRLVVPLPAGASGTPT